MYDFFALIRTSNELKIHDLRNECQQEKWAPVLVLRYPNRTVIPLFTNVQIARKFLRRNVPRNEICGVMGMIDEDTQIFINRGWEIDWHHHPRKYVDRPDIQIDVDGVEVATGFDLTATAGRPK